MTEENKKKIICSDMQYITNDNFRFSASMNNLWGLIKKHIPPEKQRHFAEMLYQVVDVYENNITRKIIDYTEEGGRPESLSYLDGDLWASRQSFGMLKHELYESGMAHYDKEPS